MNVGKDPFPRDEVTGLGAFEHLEPVGSVSVVSEKPRETPVATNPAAVSGELAPSSNSNAQPSTRSRGDATLPLDLSAMGHWGGGARASQAAAAPDDDDSDSELDEIDDVEPLAGTSAKPKSALDAMFEKSAGHAAADHDHLEDWEDDDEATRVHSRPAGRVQGDEANLAMEWDDEDEPPTETLPFAMLEELPIAAGVDLDHDHNPVPAPLAEVSRNPVDYYDEDSDDDYDSAFNNLLPLPPPQLPAQQPAPARLSASATTTARSSSTEQRAELPQDTLPARFIDALKAGHRTSVIIAAGGLLGLLALVIIARAIALSTNVGTALLEVSPADAQVQVDGRAVAGTGSPYSVSELKVGSHELLVNKRGYNDYHGNFTVSSGQSIKLPVIELAPNLLDVGFAVRSAPAGANVWLDGELTEALTPAKLTGIKPGIHRLALKHDGFSDYELQMFVPEATVLQLPAAELVALPATDKEPASGRRRARGGSRATPKSGVAAAVSGDKSGTLRLNSRPWSQVSVDGRQVGNTPQSNLQLSPGKHKLQLVNAQLGVSKNITVTIKAGETLTQVVNLAE